MAAVPPLSRKRRALLSVTDKGGLAELAAALRDHGYELIASGGTARFLREAGHSVTAVSDLTGFPAIFGGRVKTLHPLVHGGILGAREEDFGAVADLGIQPIDVVCVNLYRFAEAVGGGASVSECIEQIDIGGPALMRAAAKNHQRVTVLADPGFYAEFRQELEAGAGTTGADFRRRMAAETFARVSAYDQGIAEWFGTVTSAGNRAGGGEVELRYGENPHQKARFVVQDAGKDGALAACGLSQLGGKELSYNNLVDLVAALKLALDFTEPVCAVIKHTNPCGLGLGEPAVALEAALRCDPVSAFGGVFAFNLPVDVAATEVLRKRFLEIIAAPAYEDEALALLRKKKNVRLLTYDGDRFRAATRGTSRSFGRLELLQDEDAGFPELDDWEIVSGEVKNPELERALRLAWRVCKHVKSNAIVLANAAGCLGIGAGQMSRVDSAQLAIRKAGDVELDLTGAVAASDGFFPFPDGIERLAEAGICAVIAPRGSIRDEEVAAAAQALGVILVFTGRRHFRH